VSTSFAKNQSDIPKEKAIAFVLFILPLLFLFVYDSDRNFYRSFVINLFAGISLAMFLSRISLGKYRCVATTYFGICVVVVCISVAINWSWFTSKFREGFEGPSMSTNKNWEGIALGVTGLAQDTGMDLSKGRIIVDDMTYDALKRYPHLFPVTYLDLSGSLTKLSSADIIRKVRPNYAIVRCDYLRSWGVPPQKIRDQFCAVNFLKAGSLE
jgi:Ca2+/Na+ antiporter